MHTDETDTLYHQVIQFDGTLAPWRCGNPSAAIRASRRRRAGAVSRAQIGGETVRVASTALTDPRSDRIAWVQVAETRHKREQLASRIISGVLLPQFAIIPLAVILVYSA